MKQLRTHAGSGIPVARHVVNVHCSPARHTALFKHWLTCSPQRSRMHDTQSPSGPSGMGKASKMSMNPSTRDESDAPLSGADDPSADVSTDPSISGAGASVSVPPSAGGVGPMFSPSEQPVAMAALIKIIQELVFMRAAVAQLAGSREEEGRPPRRAIGLLARQVDAERYCWFFWFFGV
jgi:hypothetical protein